MRPSMQTRRKTDASLWAGAPKRGPLIKSSKPFFTMGLKDCPEPPQPQSTFGRADFHKNPVELLHIELSQFPLAGSCGTSPRFFCTMPNNRVNGQSALKM